jgi:hypothetical protein
MAEIVFENVLAAHEATRGTAIAAPTHLLNLEAAPPTPIDVKHRPREQRGTRGQNYRVTTTKTGTSFSGKGDADTSEILFWLNMGVMPLAAPSSTPTNGILTKLWSFIRRMTTDDEKSATMWWADPNWQVLRTVWNMLEEFSLENSAMADDGVLQLGLKGQGGPFSKAADPIVPASIAGALLPGALMTLYMDTSLAIGATAFNDRLLSSKLTVPTGRTFKRTGAGATGNKAFNRTGVVAAAPILDFTIELIDTSEYDLWDAGTYVKCRVRHNGPEIEAVTPTYQHYVEHDVYGVLSEPTWGDNNGNRTASYKIVGQVDSTLGSDLRIGVQTTRTTV